jgi:eukaryotic-like serine/threonine-protein kinase
LSRPGGLRVGRYIVEDRIAAGGMATVHIGRLRGAAGFSRTVAIKRLLPQLACNPEFESLFMHEARLVARIQHPNVVATLDVVAEAGELILVMEYVQGETLSRLMQAVAARSDRVPQRIVLAIIRDALCGLHAAHEARDRRGAPLDIVHRDISPQNLMVGSDGVTRVLDFGIAKAATSVELTRDGVVRGKAAYMAPEQLYAADVTRRADIYAIGVVLWEILVGERLFPGGLRPELAGGMGGIPTPRARGAPIDEALEAIVMRALASAPSERFETAQQMAEQIASGFEVAGREEVAAWVTASAGEDLAKRMALVAQVESADVSILPPPSTERGAVMPSGDSTSGAASFPRDASAPRPSATARSSRVRWALWLTAALASVIGMASALWLTSFSPSELKHITADSEHGPAQLEPRPGPAPSPLPASGLEKNPERPFDPGDEGSALDPRAVASRPAIAQPAVAAPPPAPSDARKLGRPRAQARAVPNPRRKADCNPPYTIDAAGRRHYKPECF